MIRYNKKISVKETKFGKRLETDRGDVYELMMINHETNESPVTTWWEKQHQSELRQWQKDVFIGEYWRQHRALNLYLVYKRGEGYSQPHDILLAHDPEINLWIMSTQEHTWFEAGDVEVIFNNEQALGSVMDVESRKEIYKVIDGL